MIKMPEQDLPKMAKIPVFAKGKQNFSVILADENGISIDFQNHILIFFLLST